MRTQRPLARLLALIASLSLLYATACGTLLYPERGGQRSGRVDPAVLLLDGALLLLFVIPGLVAFGIDFYTGAVYLPPGSKRRASVIQLHPTELSSARVEALLRAHTGHELRLDDPRWQRYELDRDADPVAVLRAWRERGAPALAALRPAKS